MSDFLRRMKRRAAKQNRIVRLHNQLLLAAKRGTSELLLSYQYASDVKALVVWHGIQDRGSKKANITALLHNIHSYSKKGDQK